MAVKKEATQASSTPQVTPTQGSQYGQVLIVV
jgi:hypothetical protein